MAHQNSTTLLPLDTFGVMQSDAEGDPNPNQFLIAELSRQLVVSQTSIPPDFVSSQTEPHGNLLVVADGMGQNGTGRRTSALAVRSFTDYVLRMMHWHLRAAEQHEDDVLSEFRDAMGFCESCLEDEAATHSEYHGMGTTLTAAYLAWPKLFVLHAGDSRCYVLREGELKQVTLDHTVAQHLVESGTLAPEAAATSEWADCVWNAIGGITDSVRPQLAFVEMKPGDSIFLCSDRLKRYISDRQLLTILSSRRSAGQVCERLVQDARDRGGRDNLTIVVARIPSHIDVSENTEISDQTAG